ncbi:hypothetical protein [Dactylosporangium aurantiacum]|uniref:hypothetical protein n=1 Tax=Dactylosporangium aurantiacum TaxID=35754 RepID=UPI001FE025E4|nr:hypothetical protein [Dactylosporangium aurantiacum]MDG6105468.1 hypothetical protein [Dactylosporangium aurantiacum]
MAEDLDPAAGRQQQRDEHLDRRGLAGAVGPEQAEQLAALDLEGDAAHGVDDLLGAAQPAAGAEDPPQVGHIDDAHPRPRSRMLRRP